MKARMLRNLLLVGLFSITLFATNLRPAAAQTWTPMPMGCYFQGQTYPIGTVLHFVLPEPQPVHVYMRCELKIQPYPGGPRPQWVYYSSNPG